MKYIRKEDGVHKLYDTRKWADNHWGYKPRNYLTILLDEETIKNSKTADTIEDLCDCYVVYEESGGFKGYHRTYNDLKLAKYSANLDTSVIYGAIWAKGEHDEPILKSVAKMNEKGEFELLEEKE